MCSSINVTLDPLLRDRLLSGDINVLSCDLCKNSALIQTPLLYHDMKREFCVQYYPPEAIDDAEFMKQFDQEVQFKLDGLPARLAGRYLSHPHVVFDLNEMIRYVLFREKLKP